MTILISDIHSLVESDLGESIDSETILTWCNQAQSDFGTGLNIPATSTLSVTTTELTYELPTDLKIITRLWSQTDYDNGIDEPLQTNYRIYNGAIIFQTYFREADTINVDYYKQLKYFTALSDAIDLDDRFVTIYTLYCRAMYFQLRKSIQGNSIRDFRLAMMAAQSIMGMYQAIKNQVLQQYSFRNEPSVIAERW